MPARTRRVLATAFAAATLCASCTETREVRVDEPTATSHPRRAAQPRAAAERDRVPADVSALPFRQRVNPKVTVSEDEERWVVSTPRGRDAARYAEILKLDERRPRRVLRAYPFRRVPPNRLVLRDDAVYCGRSRDAGGRPDALVCRIDRDTLEIVVRVFPSDRGAPWIDDYPDDWTIDDSYLDVRRLEVNEDGVWAKGFDGTWAHLDRSTLRVLERGLSSPRV